MVMRVTMLTRRRPPWQIYRNMIGIGVRTTRWKRKGGKGKYINSVFTAAIQPLFHVVPPPPPPRKPTNCRYSYRNIAPTWWMCQTSLDGNGLMKCTREFMIEFLPSIWHLFKTNTNEHSNKVDDEGLMAF